MIWYDWYTMYLLGQLHPRSERNLWARSKPSTELVHRGLDWKLNDEIRSLNDSFQIVVSLSNPEETTHRWSDEGHVWMLIHIHSKVGDIVQFLWFMAWIIMAISSMKKPIKSIIFLLFHKIVLPPFQSNCPTFHIYIFVPNRLSNYLPG